MTDEAPGLPEAPPAVAPARGWRDGLRDMARGAEFGVWFSALASAPIACALVGASLGMLGHVGFDWWSALGMVAFAAGWAGKALVLSLPIAAPAGVIAWLYRGIAKRLGRPGPDRPTRRRRRRRRWAVVAGLGMVGMIAGVVTGNSLIRTSHRNAEEATAETDAIDPEWRLDDLLAARDGVPDDENSALTVADVDDILGDPWPPTTPKGAPQPGVAEILADASRIGEADDSRWLDDASVAALRAALEEQTEAVDLAITLLDYDCGRHEYEIGPTILDTPLPETQAARNVVRLLNADATVAAHDGDIDAALGSCRAMIAAARSIGDEPFAVGQLSRMAIDAVASRVTRRVLGLGEPSDEALAALQDLVLDELDQPRARWALRGERAQVAEIIRRVATGEMPISALSEGGATAAAGGRGSVLLLVGGWHQYSLALRWCNDLIAILDLPESEWLAALEEWDARLQSVRRSRLAFLTATLPILLMPAATAVVEAELRTRADLGSLAVLLAAERQRMATGKWPASVDEIAPEILPEPPRDPYTGEPFRVLHVDGRLRVYSLGANRKDERGTHDPRKAAMNHVEDDVGVYAYDPVLRGRPAVAEETP